MSNTAHHDRRNVMKFKRGIATLGIAVMTAIGAPVVSATIAPASASAASIATPCRHSASYWDSHYNTCWKQLRIPRPDWRRYP